MNLYEADLRAMRGSALVFLRGCVDPWLRAKGPTHASQARKKTPAHRAGLAIFGTNETAQLAELMKAQIVIGIVLVVLGIVTLANPLIGYTEREEVLKLGPLEATAETPHAIHIPALAGWVLIVGGVALIAVGARKVE